MNTNIDTVTFTEKATYSIPEDAAVEFGTGPNPFAGMSITFWHQDER